MLKLQFIYLRALLSQIILTELLVTVGPRGSSLDPLSAVKSLKMTYPLFGMMRDLSMSANHSSCLDGFFFYGD